MTPDTLEAYKLFRVRRDGTLGPLFIGRRMRIPLGVWLDAEDIPTRGFARRPGWHAAPRPHAPHLTLRGRVWARVELQGAEPLQRPERQGGTWWLARRMRVLEVACRGSGNLSEQVPATSKASGPRDRPDENKTREIG